MMPARQTGSRGLVADPLDRLLRQRVEPALVAAQPEQLAVVVALGVGHVGSARELERLLRERLRLLELARDLVPLRVPGSGEVAVEGLAQPVGQVPQAGVREPRRLHVPLLEEVVHAPVQRGRPVLARAPPLDQPQQLGADRQALEQELGVEQGVVQARQGHDERVLVAQPARDRHGLAAERLDVLGRAAEVQRLREAGEHARPRPAVALAEHVARLLQQRQPLVLRVPGVVVAPPEAERGGGEALRIAHCARERGGLPERRLRISAVAGAPLRAPARHQQVAALLLPVDELERAGLVPGSLLVGVARRGPVGGGERVAPAPSPRARGRATCRSGAPARLRAGRWSRTGLRAPRRSARAAASGHSASAPHRAFRARARDGTRSGRRGREPRSRSRRAPARRARRRRRPARGRAPRRASPARTRARSPRRRRAPRARPGSVPESRRRMSVSIPRGTVWNCLVSVSARRSSESECIPWSVSSM